MISFSKNKLYREWNILFQIAFVFSMLLFSCNKKSEISYQTASALQDSVDTYLRYSNNSELSREARIASISKALLFARDIKDDSLKKTTYGRVRKAFKDIKSFDHFKGVNNEIIDFCLKMNDSLGVAKAHSSFGYHYSESKRKWTALMLVIIVLKEFILS